MRLIRHCGEFGADRRGCVVALGNFDGVHLGHQSVILTARDLAGQGGVASGVLTFEPHPRRVFRPDLPPFRLTPFRVKARLIEALGIDLLFQQTFDPGFAAVTADAFIKDILVGCMGVSQVVVGYDYVFGKDRGGDCALLESAGAELGFGVTVVPPTEVGGEPCSSTRVRAALASGRPADAAHLLGHYWELEGRVEHGSARGRQLGFPTANVRLGEYQHPATGVYAVRAGVDRGGATVWHDGVANFGRRPTFDQTDEVLEVHLFGLSEDLYGRHLRVALIDHLRPERKFSGVDELRAQIVRDAETARQRLGGLHFPATPGPMVPVAP
ncbi:bifunctional riboflavin kinase/FAD synthetase [Magnetospirillum fulvum]|uniref:Riboflavin biosynthesis protein n=1 Tax=Magnetospirillum fulvum MGU-K5 TaxID=1316936 RepID=S9S9P2_MAGFU|nr:bifunctional riboflavin kinase/FAD synthetase [Magnetospirillum fulvum]EPY01419.1 FAD synthase [Magnetospirillum fulvum MGU-K5]